MNQWKEYIERYDTVFAFLGLEILTLICFGLGGASGSLIIRMIGFFIAAAMVPFIRINHGNQELKAYAIELIPLLVLAVFGGFSAFSLTSTSGGFASMFSAFITDATVTLGILGFFLLAIALKHNKTVKMDWILLALGGSLGLLVLITTIYSVSRYGFFYSALYSGKYYYWDGSRFPLSTEGKALYGFQFLETTLEFSSFFAFALACALPGALFINPKKEEKRFAAVLGLGLLGLVSIAVIPYVRALILLAPIYLFALVFRFLKHKKETSKGERITGYVLAGLILFGLLILFVDANLPKSFMAKIPFIGRFFATGDMIMVGGRYFRTSFFGTIENQIYLTFHNANGGIDILSILFGNYFRLGTNGLRLKSATSGLYLGDFITKSFEFNFLFQNGFIAFAALVLVIFQAFIWGNRYLKRGEGELYSRIIPVLMLIGSFIYLSLLSDEMPFAHTSSYSFIPLTRESRFFILFFLLGLIYMPKEQKAIKEGMVTEEEPVTEAKSIPEFEEVSIDE
ncbi:MAG: hypothetical protein MJ239_03720 [Bacilli bacterium]|nr:hypothetical protein [Bacilli bacterium]